MKPSIVALLMTVVAACAAQPTVTEERLPGGISVIKITAADGRGLDSYRIDLSTHHYPAASADDPRVKRFRSWRFGAFLCFNSNLPFEYEPCSQQRGSELLGRWDYPGAVWFTYGRGNPFVASQPFPAEFLYQRIHLAYQRGANSVLLACAPDYTGKFREEDVEQLVKLGKMLKDPMFSPKVEPMRSSRRHPSE